MAAGRSGGDESTRVFHLITRFYSGGAEKTTLHTLDALTEAEQNYDVRLGVGAFHDAERLESVADQGIETTVFDSIRHYNPLAAIIAVVAVAVHLWREDIDILHTHSTEAGIIGRFASVLSGTEVVIHEVHGDPVTDDRSWLLNRFLLAAERFAAAVTTIIVVKSTHIRETFLDRGIGDRSKYTTVYHGVHLEQYRSVEADDVALTGDGPVVTYVGRLTDGKGLVDLLDCAERLAGDTDFDLLIVGDGELRDHLEESIAERNLSDNVHLVGYREDVPSLLAASDVFVLPSYREGTPRAVTEALASGTPVVSTRIAGIPEQVSDGETGYLVEPGDVGTLTRRIKQLLCDRELREEMREQTGESLEKFDIATAQRAFQELYRRLSETCS